MTDTITPAAPLVPYSEMCSALKAKYLTEHPDLVGWEQRDGGRTQVYGPKDYDGDAGARAITLACTGGTDDKTKYRDVSFYLRDRMMDKLRRPLSALPKHSHWDIRADALRLLCGYEKVYEWKRGDGPQPTQTQALEQYGSGVAPVSRKRNRLLGAVYLDDATWTAYDIFDTRLYVIPRSGSWDEASGPKGQNAEGVDLYDPGEYDVAEYRVRFYFADPNGSGKVR